MDIKYIIFDHSEIDSVNFDEILETSKETLRLTNDGKKTFIKWVGNEPSFISNLQTKSIIYNNEDMLEILSQTDWLPISGTTL